MASKLADKTPCGNRHFEDFCVGCGTSEYVCSVDHEWALARLDTVTKERDRLVEALEQIGICELELVNGGYANKNQGALECTDDMAKIANDALEALEESGSKP